MHATFHQQTALNLFSSEIIMDGETVGRWILEVGNRLFEEVGSTLCHMSKGCFFGCFANAMHLIQDESNKLYNSYISIYKLYWNVWDVRAVVVFCGDFPEYLFSSLAFGTFEFHIFPLPCFRDHFQDYLHGSRRSAESWHLIVLMMNIIW